jgi:HEPN domain
VGCGPLPHLGHKRSDLQVNAEAKLEDARILFQNKRYSGAYYLAGYTVELALKARIAATMVAETIPDKTFIKKVFDHDLNALVGVGGLRQQLKEQEDKDPDFAAKWAIVAQWTPEVRYDTVSAIDATIAQTLISAIDDPKSGVLQWIKAFW